MSTVLSDPTSTTSNTGALTGGATAHAVLADSSDASYVTLDYGEFFLVGFDDPTIPAGAVVKQLAIICRAKRTSGYTQMTAILTTSDGGAIPKTVNLTDTAFVNSYVVVDKAERDADSATCSILITGAATPIGQVAKLFLATTYVAQPTVNVVAPTGTLTEDNVPTVEWEGTLDSDGGLASGSTVKIFSAAQYGAGGFDPETSDAVFSGSVSGSIYLLGTSDPLPNGDYRAYVKVTQTVNGVAHESDWDYEAFTVDVDSPADPTVTLTPEPSAGRVKIEVDDNSGDATTDAFEIQREIGDDEWEAVRTLEGDGLLTGTSGTVYDYECENGIVQTYRVRAIHHYSASDTYSDWEEATTTLDTTRWWIKHPTDPSINLQCDLRSFAGHDRPARQTIKQPLGRSDAVAISDTRGPETGTIVVRCSDDATRDAVMALATTVTPLLLSPPEGHHERNRWVVLGDEAVSRLIDKSWSDERDASYPWTEVARPDGAIEAWPA